MPRSPAGELDDEFRSFVLGSQARILRFAELLTGDRHAAEDLTQHGFAKLYASWRRLHTGNPEQYVAAASSTPTPTVGVAERGAKARGPTSPSGPITLTLSLHLPSTIS